ncbi:MAG: hypothetical protein NTX89_00295 [Candidatus Omnitrophica bacterium]|nr:hypothetical protein [Candidatus Omnitrophota bacterium]
MATKRFAKYLSRAILLIIALAFIIKFGGPNILRQYISYGIGDCKTTPILCMQPGEKIFTPPINSQYRDTLIPHAFPRMSVSVPKGFTLVQELIKKQYYKKRHTNNNAVIHLLIQEPGAFIKLYPDVQKQGVRDNYEFIRRLMYANLGRIENITDAFFLIMKSVFTPDIGNQSTAKMIKFQLPNLKGFINYSMAKPNNYFDCNISDAEGNFFKVYIKDIGARLDLNNVFAIISTLKPVN